MSAGKPFVANNYANSYCNAARRHTLPSIDAHHAASLISSTSYAARLSLPANKEKATVTSRGLVCGDGDRDYFFLAIFFFFFFVLATIGAVLAMVCFETTANKVLVHITADGRYRGAGTTPCG